ncbi:MAG: hypothetical protein NVSMB51_16270 [Solirubrobacteraceae bacterium]
MRMRQSLAQLERQFEEEIRADRDRRELLVRSTAVRARERHVQRETKRSTLRFVLLSLTLIATAVLVTVAMFKTLYLVIG